MIKTGASTTKASRDMIIQTGSSTGAQSGEINVMSASAGVESSFVRLSAGTGQVAGGDTSFISGSGQKGGNFHISSGYSVEGPGGMVRLVGQEPLELESGFQLQELLGRWSCVRLTPLRAGHIVERA